MENTGITIEQFRDEFVRFQVNLVKVIDEKFKKVDTRFDSMEKKFDEKFDLCATKEQFGLCATKEQFTLLEKGIAQVAGKLLQMENNMKVFVVRQELKAFPTKEEVTHQIDAKLKGKRIGGLAVADNGQEYSAEDSEKN